MTEHKVYRLAWFMALEIYQKEQDLADKGGALAKARAEAAWKEVKFLEAKLAEFEAAENRM